MLRRWVVGAIVLVVAGCAQATDIESSVDELVEPRYTADRSDWPEPPRLPDDFDWVGRYIVPDLGVEVPFTWSGHDGDFQMIAGGEAHPIHFTNLVYDGELFTLTYEWPGVPRQPCSHVGAFTLEQLNDGFAEASFAGRETLHGDADREVNHFRSVGVVELPPELLADLGDGLPLRFPLMAGDIYTDADDSEQIWQLLHFGLQNLYDPNLDEWIIIDQASDAPGEVVLPDECTTN